MLHSGLHTGPHSGLHPGERGPTPPEDRLVALDALRGFALLGVLVVNVYQSYGVRLSPLDAAVAGALETFAAGSFYPAFSLLFGLGFALQLGRGWGAARLRRRLGVLLGFGLLHGFLVWHGDILASYAVVGFALPALAKLPGARLLALGLLGYGASALLFYLAVDPLASPDGDGALFAGGSYAEMLAWRALRYADALLGGLAVFGPQLLALFALGLALGRGGLERRLRDRRFLTRALLACLALALPILVVEGLGNGPSRLTSTLEYLVASPALGFAYLALFALLLAGGLGRVLRPFAAVGRTALSSYLAQSLVCTFFFYGYGLGVYGRTGVAANLALSLLLFALQLLLAHVWLRLFRFGPAEWLWRSLSYGKVQPLRRSPDRNPEA